MKGFLPTRLFRWAEINKAQKEFDKVALPAGKPLTKCQGRGENEVPLANKHIGRFGNQLF